MSKRDVFDSGEGGWVSEIEEFLRSMGAGDPPPFILDEHKRIIYGNLTLAKARGMETTAAYILEASLDNPLERIKLLELRAKMVAEYGDDGETLS